MYSRIGLCGFSSFHSPLLSNSWFTILTIIFSNQFSPEICLLIPCDANSAINRLIYDLSINEELAPQTKLQNRSHWHRFDVARCAADQPLVSATMCQATAPIDIWIRRRNETEPNTCDWFVSILFSAFRMKKWPASSDKMALDGENASAKLPSAFQSLSMPTSSTISKTDQSNPSTANHLYGYRSNFNVNEEKAKYQQQRQQQSSLAVSPPAPATHQHGQRQPYHQQFHKKSRNNERFADNNGNQRNDFRTDSGGGCCEVCDRNFKTQQQLDRHLSEHEKRRQTFFLD